MPGWYLLLIKDLLNCYSYVNGNISYFYTILALSIPWLFLTISLQVVLKNQISLPVLITGIIY